MIHFLTQTGLEFGVYKGKWQNLHPGDGGTEILRGLVFYSTSEGGGATMFSPLDMGAYNFFMPGRRALPSFCSIFF